MFRCAIGGVVAAAVMMGLSVDAFGKDMPPLVHEAVISVPAEKVWAVFSTSEGFKHFGVAQAEVDFRIGGKIRSHYKPDGVLGDPGTIEQTILAFEPLRMMSWKCTKVPEGFPFPAAMANCWNVAYIEDLGDGRTRLTLKGMGYDDTEESVKMRAFFDAGNAWSMQKLRANLEGTPAPTTSGHDAANAGKGSNKAPVLLSNPESDGPIEVEAVVSAPIAEVWKAWTTTEGVSSFVGRPAKIELSPGGAYEIYFGQKAPEGQRGSEGCTVLAYEPMRMLAFTWNAPPAMPHAREERTWVVVRLEEAGPGQTRVHLSHQGIEQKIAAEPQFAAEWREVREHFVEAWPRFVGSLQQHFAAADGGGVAGSTGGTSGSVSGASPTGKPG